MGSSEGAVRQEAAYTQINALVRQLSKLSINSSRDVNRQYRGIAGDVGNKDVLVQSTTNNFQRVASNESSSMHQSKVFNEEVNMNDIAVRGSSKNDSNGDLVVNKRVSSNRSYATGAGGEDDESVSTANSNVRSKRLKNRFSRHLDKQNSRADERSGTLLVTSRDIYMPKLLTSNQTNESVSSSVHIYNREVINTSVIPEGFSSDIKVNSDVDICNIKLIMND
jgi:hypothetical protein